MIIKIILFVGLMICIYYIMMKAQDNSNDEIWENEHENKEKKE
tara:strand:- start:3423 stop:3551 length:129 start_codon:yes stop_codon:yes gene_type:complete